ncbi:MAG: hypothetical protein R6U70_05615 [Bacillota bacterium]
MVAVTVVLWAIAVLVSIVVALLLILLFIPTRYRVDGGYDDAFRTSFDLHCTPFLAINGSWSTAPEEHEQTQIVVAGIPFSIEPGRQTRRKSKKTSEKKEGKGVPFLAILEHLTGDFLGRCGTLMRDLLKALRPKRLDISGRIGFAEPHLNGWLAAALARRGTEYEWINLDIEPVWQREHYEFHIVIEDSLALCAVLVPIVRFVLARPTRQFIKAMRRQRASQAA